MLEKEGGNNSVFWDLLFLGWTINSTSWKYCMLYLIEDFVPVAVTHAAKCCSVTFASSSLIFPLQGNTLLLERLQYRNAKIERRVTEFPSYFFAVRSLPFFLLHMEYRNLISRNFVFVLYIPGIFSPHTFYVMKNSKRPQFFLLSHV